MTDLRQFPVIKPTHRFTSEPYKNYWLLRDERGFFWLNGKMIGYAGEHADRFEEVRACLTEQDVWKHLPDPRRVNIELGMSPE